MDTKIIFRLRTKYANGDVETNGFFSTEEKALDMVQFLMKNNPLGTEKEFKSSNISKIEVSTKTEKINDGGTEWVIL